MPFGGCVLVTETLKKAGFTFNVSPMPFGGCVLVTTIAEALVAFDTAVSNAFRRVCAGDQNLRATVAAERAGLQCLSAGVCW